MRIAAIYRYDLFSKQLFPIPGTEDFVLTQTAVGGQRMKLHLGEPGVLGKVFVPESMCSGAFVDIR